MKQLEVMVVEDDPGDVRLIHEALRNSQVAYRLRVVRDGVEALDLLYRKGRFHDATRPNIILLDLNLPRKNGWQVLREVKSDENLKHIPIIVFSTSDSAEDIKATYDLHANSYITKPDDFDAYLDAVRAIETFWLTLAQLP